MVERVLGLQNGLVIGHIFPQGDCADFLFCFLYLFQQQVSFLPVLESLLLVLFQFLENPFVRQGGLLLDDSVLLQLVILCIQKQLIVEEFFVLVVDQFLQILHVLDQVVHFHLQFLNLLFLQEVLGFYFFARLFEDHILPRQGPFHLNKQFVFLIQILNVMLLPRRICVHFVHLHLNFLHSLLQKQGVLRSLSQLSLICLYLSVIDFYLLQILSDFLLQKSNLMLQLNDLFSLSGQLLFEGEVLFSSMVQFFSEIHDHGVLKMLHAGRLHQ